jgi:hypothetical protein
MHVFNTAIDGLTFDNADLSRHSHIDPVYYVHMSLNRVCAYLHITEQADVAVKTHNRTSSLLRQV